MAKKRMAAIRNGELPRDRVFGFDLVQPPVYRHNRWRCKREKPGACCDPYSCDKRKYEPFGQLSAADIECAVRFRFLFLSHCISPFL